MNIISCNTKSLNTIIINCNQEKNRFSTQVWDLLTQAYLKVKGGLHFDSIEHLVESSSQWRLSVVGGEVVAAVVFKAKKGLKITAFCLNPNFYVLGKSELISMIKISLKTGWIEVSEAAEKFIMTYCDGTRYIVNNILANGLLDKEIVLNRDGYHYSRTVQNTLKEKLIVGTPNV